jgi:hypothetical protein
LQRSPVIAIKNSVDLSSPKVYSNAATLKFDYKFATTKFERFVPVGLNGEGTYVGYNDGAIWKIGNNRSSENGDTNRSSSKPDFLTHGEIRNPNGIDAYGLTRNGGFILSNTSTAKFKNKYVPKEEAFDNPVGSTPEEKAKESDDSNKKTKIGSTLENLKNSSVENAKKEANRLKDLGIAKANTAKLAAQNIRELLLQTVLNKIANAPIANNVFGPNNGVSAPRNIYKQAYFYKDPNSGQTFYNDRLVNPEAVPPGPISLPYSIRFYDVRAQLLSFVGDSLGDRIYTYK